MPGMFCRHNRLTSKCPICSRELEEQLRSKAPVRHVTVRKPGASSTPRARSDRRRRARSGRLVTRKLARAADDGYRNPLVPGLQGDRRCRTARDRAHRRRTRGSSRPGRTRDRRDARRRAGDLAGVPVRARARAPRRASTRRSPPWADADVSRAARRPSSAPPPPTAPGSSAPARRRPRSRARRSGRPERRFGRVFERLALPGFTPRRALRPADRARRRRPLPARGATPCTSSRTTPTTLAAKRALVSGDRMLLERRARDLADASELPIAALRPRPRRLGHARRARRPDRGPGPGRRRRARHRGRPWRCALPLSPRAPRACSSGSRRRPRPSSEPPPKARPWKLLLLGCFALAGAHAAAPERPDLRPVGVDHLGPRDRPRATW